MHLLTFRNLNIRGPKSRDHLKEVVDVNGIICSKGHGHEFYCISNEIISEFKWVQYPGQIALAPSPESDPVIVNQVKIWLKTILIAKKNTKIPPRLKSSGRTGSGMDGQTDGQTDRCTDRQTDRRLN